MMQVILRLRCLPCFRTTPGSKMIGMSLELNETESGEFLKQLKNESPDQKGVASLDVTKENVDFPAVYAYLNQSSTKTVTESDTWNEDKFYRNNKKIGRIGFVIPKLPSLRYIIPVNTVSM